MSNSLMVRRQIVDNYPSELDDMLESEINRSKRFKRKEIRASTVVSLTDNSVSFDEAKKIFDLSDQGYGIYRLSSKENNEDLGVWYLEDGPDGKILKKSVDDSEEFELVRRYLNNEE